MAPLRRLLPARAGGSHRPQTNGLKLSPHSWVWVTNWPAQWVQRVRHSMSLSTNLTNRQALVIDSIGSTSSARTFSR